MSSPLVLSLALTVGTAVSGCRHCPNSQSAHSAHEPGARTSANDPAPPIRPQTIANTELRSLPRSANGREYMLYVALPESYAEHPERRYPVLYLCDGYWDFNLVKGFYGNLVYDQVVPEFIIVGFGYQGDKPDFERLRRVDYTPVTEGRATASGHASEFLAVVERQIVPFVEQTYRADPTYRTLAGSSLGGLFVLYTMFTKPELFQSYIAPSPAVGWANDWLFSHEEAFAKRGGALHARLFMTVAENEEPGFIAQIRRFDARLKERAYPGLTYQFRTVEGERHAGTKAESYNRGVRFALAPRAPAQDPR